MFSCGILVYHHHQPSLFVAQSVPTCRLRAYAEQNVTGSVPWPPLHTYIACIVCVRSIIISITPPHSHSVIFILCGIRHGDGLNKENRLAKPTSVWWQFTDQALVLLVSTPPPHPVTQSTRFHNDDQPLLLTDCSALFREQQTYQHAHVTASSSNYPSSPHPTHQ